MLSCWLRAENRVTMGDEEGDFIAIRFVLGPLTRGNIMWFMCHFVENFHDTSERVFPNWLCVLYGRWETSKMSEGHFIEIHLIRDWSIDLWEQITCHVTKFSRSLGRGFPNCVLKNRIKHHKESGHLNVLNFIYPGSINEVHSILFYLFPNDWRSSIK